ncbi:unnamed protein product [Ceratitis capitata]|uniref:(Mediterranean fruit fly) hypothetical protein n=1 Tax=Ceratitis capitata TaxID=7213 RepID=W8C2D3_CERCA|nr:unnamed protein product [Ceratitis capitata]
MHTATNSSATTTSQHKKQQQLLVEKQQQRQHIMNGKFECAANAHMSIRERETETPHTARTPTPHHRSIMIKEQQKGSITQSNNINDNRNKNNKRSLSVCIERRTLPPSIKTDSTQTSEWSLDIAANISTCRRQDNMSVKTQTD